MVHYDNTVFDYTPVVRNILNQHPDGNLVLEFENKTYSFYPEEALEEYVCVSNNDNGVKRIAFRLKNMRNVTIQGDETSFLFHGSIVPFLISGSSEISVKGIDVDYDFPFVLEGTVVSNDSADNSIVIKIDSANRYEVRGERLFFKGYNWESGLGENIVFNPKTRSPYYCTEKYETNSGVPLKAEELSDRMVKLSGGTFMELPPVGSVYVDKGSYMTNRLYPGFIIQKGNKIDITDVTVYCSGAMALIAEKSRDITCTRYNVKVRDGSGRMISSSADATHFVGCSGTVTLDDCIFESMLDDATNIHGTYMKIVRKISDYKFGATFGHMQQYGYEFAEKGDELLFINRNGLRPIGKGKVKKIEKVSDSYYIITTDLDLSQFDDGIEIAVDNISYYANAVITNCKVRYNRARSLLISTFGDVLVEKCDFASMMAGIRICGDANYWFESGQTSNVIIRSNTFSNLSNGGWSPQAVLQIDPVIASDARGCDWFFHKKIIFEDNTVYSYEDQLIYALSVDNLIIKNNKFIDSKIHPVRYAGLPVIDIQYSNSVNITGNDFSQWKENAVISFHKCNDNCINDIALPTVDNPNKFYYEN